MINLTSKQWNMINEMIYAFNIEKNLNKLRKDFLTTIRSLIPYERAFFDLGYSMGTKVVFFHPVAVNMEDQFLESYYDEFQFVDTMFWFFANNQNDIYRESDYISPAMRDTSVFYSDWLAPQDILFSVGSKVVFNNILYGSINLWRSEEHGDFSDEEVQIITILNRHLSLRFYSQFPHGIRKDSDNDYSESLAHLYHLTPRELEIVDLLYQGQSIKDISQALFITENTVKKHSHNVFGKMKVSSRTQLIKIVHDHMDR